jgi:6-pyruvoyltetrahydropterin/6-carboxytetrahydropterin synthase
MYLLELTTTFSAAHAILISGWREPLHGHDWHVTITIGGPSLDGDGLLVDFHEVQAHLDAIITPFRNANLNDCEPFASGLNPTAELVAWHICQVLSARLQSRRPDKPKTNNTATPPIRVVRVRVTEAVGCAAVYEPSPTAARMKQPSSKSSTQPPTKSRPKSR